MQPVILILSQPAIFVSLHCLFDLHFCFASFFYFLYLINFFSILSQPHLLVPIPSHSYYMHFKFAPFLSCLPFARFLFQAALASRCMSHRQFPCPCIPFFLSHIFSYIPIPILPFPKISNYGL